MILCVKHLFFLKVLSSKLRSLVFICLVLFSDCLAEAVQSHCRETDVMAGLKPSHIAPILLPLLRRECNTVFFFRVKKKRKRFLVFKWGDNSMALPWAGWGKGELLQEGWGQPRYHTHRVWSSWFWGLVLVLPPPPSPCAPQDKASGPA